MRTLFAAAVLFAAPAAAETPQQPELRKSCPGVTDAHCIVLRATLRDEKEWKDGLPPLPELAAGRAPDGKAAYLEPDGGVAEPGKVFRLLRDFNRRRQQDARPALLAGPAVAARELASALPASAEAVSFDGSAPFLSGLGSDDFDTRRRAARELGDRVDAMMPRGTETGPKRWDRYLSEAPGLFANVVRSAPGGALDGEARAALRKGLNALNRMSEAEVGRFVAGLDDPRAILLLMSSDDPADVAETRGLHSGTAKKFYERFQRAGKDFDLAGLLSGTGDSPLDAQARADILRRLVRFELVDKEFARDPRLLAATPALLFGPESKVAQTTLFTMADKARRTSPAFVDKTLDLAASLPVPHNRPALYYLALLEGLSDAQKSRLDGLLAKDPDARARLTSGGDEVRVPALYEHWSGNLNVGVVMVRQGSHPEEFVASLGKDWMGPRGVALGRGRLKEGVPHTFIRKDRKVRVTFYLHDAKDEHGWAKDRGAVTAMLNEWLRSSSFDVVAYRGHIGDYAPGLLSAADQVKPYVHKAFLDLSCDSNQRMDHILARCQECLFFGTTTTARGRFNTPFFLKTVDLLSQRADFSRISSGLDEALGADAPRYTGNHTMGSRWCALSARCY